MQEDPSVEVVRRLCDDLTRDIKNVKEKAWIVPALVSHVALLLKQDEEKTKLYVHTWWKRSVNKAF